MTRPEDGGAKPPLVTYIVHKKTHGTKCDICEKKQRIAVFILDEDDDKGMYSFIDICLCLKCLRKASIFLKADKYGDLNSGNYTVTNISKNCCGQKNSKFGCSCGCDHCRNTPYFDKNKPFVEFCPDMYNYTRNINLCKGCVDYMIKMLEDAYNIDLL